MCIYVCMYGMFLARSASKPHNSRPSPIHYHHCWWSWRLQKHRFQQARQADSSQAIISNLLNSHQIFCFTPANHVCNAPIARSLAKTSQLTTILLVFNLFIIGGTRQLNTAKPRQATPRPVSILISHLAFFLLHRRKRWKREKTNGFHILVDRKTNHMQ